MADLSDEVLMAYADGLLDPAERIDVEASIKEHPEYQRKVEKFRATLKPVHQAFQVALEGNELGLGARITQELPATAPVSKVQTIAPGNAQPRASSIGVRFPWPTALAASLALAVGGGLGWFMHSSPQRDPTAADLITFGDGSLQAEGALAQLLETVKSGAVVSARDVHCRAWQLKTIFSFRSMANLPCRRYELTNDATRRFAGYACRNTNAQWRTEAHVRLDAKMKGKLGFALAGGSNEVPLDAAIRAYMDSDVLQSAEEFRLIENHWSEDGGK